MADVRFTNGHGSRIYVAYMMFDTACGADCGDPWTVRGWINLDPGQTKTRPTNNRFCYYYAEDDNGATWGGNFNAEVKQEQFEKCTCLGVSVSHGQNPWHSVGMDELDLNQFGGVGFNG